MLDIDYWQFFLGILKVMWALWPVWVFGLFLILYLNLVKYFLIWFEKWLNKRWLEKHKSLLEWRKLDHKKFEQITAIIFEKLGYKTEVIGGAGDWGIDIITKKEGERHFIQCKQMDVVKPNYVREFYGSIVDQLKEGEKGFLVTTGEFTQDGKEFAKTRKKPIELVNGFRLEKIFKNEEKLNN